MRKQKVLFLCTQNSARSQMAEGFLRHLAGDRFETYSAGIDPTPEIHPCAVEAMGEVGIDISEQYPKGLRTYMGKMGFNYLIIVCARAEERCSKSDCPLHATIVMTAYRGGQSMGVLIGIDPHKKSVNAAAAIDEQGELLGHQTFPANQIGLRALERWAKRFPERRWAVEGAAGIGRPVAQRLAMAGEKVVDVPPKLSSKARLLSTGNARKNDRLDATFTAQAALRSPDPDRDADRSASSAAPAPTEPGRSLSSRLRAMGAREARISDSGRRPSLRDGPGPHGSWHGCP